MIVIPVICYPKQQVARFFAFGSKIHWLALVKDRR
jgi:hypothetical protein